MSKAEDVASLSFEAAMRELEEIVSALEKGNVDLDKSIALYERGEILKKHCEALLKSAEARVEKIVQGPDGSAKGVAPLDVE
ncbi:exodeoxyribonuclease VII small subunit [Rhodoblastus sp.]|uniref:exodeoxyribonuclease VII small subunit n=1 Tax=Rhodoblastus sp. TaxID=1962975 RepID=UPI002633C133|nr:exodeoxyribonuclease VII small subunit [Rhodoblastus sp.]